MIRTRLLPTNCRKTIMRIWSGARRTGNSSISMQMRVFPVRRCSIATALFECSMTARPGRSTLLSQKAYPGLQETLLTALGMSASLRPLPLRLECFLKRKTSSHLTSTQKCPSPLSQPSHRRKAIQNRRS